jgi:predicted ABC-type ATPase
MSKKIYIVSGCNGAGKTTASYTILPEILDCKEFVNADEIAKGLSPFQPETVAFEAGRIMLERLDSLLLADENFAFETTLASRTFVSFIKKAKALDYEVTLLFFWLSSKELAVNRVKTRVEEGGHNIPKDVIERRYDRGLINFFELYLPLVNHWMFIDNSGTPYQEICQSMNDDVEVFEKDKWNKIKEKYGK